MGFASILIASTGLEAILKMVSKTLISAIIIAQLIMVHDKSLKS